LTKHYIETNRAIAITIRKTTLLRIVMLVFHMILDNPAI